MRQIARRFSCHWSWLQQSVERRCYIASSSLTCNKQTLNESNARLCIKLVQANRNSISRWFCADDIKNCSVMGRGVATSQIKRWRRNVESLDQNKKFTSSQLMVYLLLIKNWSNLYSIGRSDNSTCSHNVFRQRELDREVRSNFEMGSVVCRVLLCHSVNSATMLNLLPLVTHTLGFILKKFWWRLIFEFLATSFREWFVLPLLLRRMPRSSFLQ